MKKESKLTFENVPTMSWIQYTEISGELLFSQLLDSFLEIQRDFLEKMAGPMLACDFWHIVSENVPIICKGSSVCQGSHPPFSYETREWPTNAFTFVGHSEFNENFPEIAQKGM